MYERIQRLLAALATDLHERDEAVRLGLLAAAAGESLFLLGPPGTGKSLIARRLQQAFRDATSFSYLMGRFSTPDEVFGPLSIRALRDEDRYERATEHYLPDADVVFLDEIWKASPPIQNALLTALNERRFRNGTREVSIPMKVFIGASNELPSDADEAAAFWDRFLIRLVVNPIDDSEAFAALLAETDDPYRDVVPDELRLSDEEYRRLREAERTVTLPPNVVDLLSAIRRSLATGDDDAAPVYVSDRRWKKIGGLLRMSALLHGRTHVEPIDCAIVRACAWSTLEERERVASVVSSELAARSGRRRSAERFQGRIEELRTGFRRLTAEVIEDEELQPIVYRDEYYRLVPEGTAEPTGATASVADDEQLLVWHGDVEDARRGGEAEIDLFVYDSSGTLVGSQRSPVRVEGTWRLAVDGAPFAIETSVARITREARREPDAAERAALVTQVEALLIEIDQELEELVAEQSTLEDAARAHLFVPAADASVVLDATRRSARRIGEIRLLAVELAGLVAGR